MKHQKTSHKLSNTIKKVEKVPQVSGDDSPLKIKNDYATKYSNFYWNSKAKKVINESDIDNLIETIYNTIISNIQKFLGKGSGWTIDLLVDHIINTKYNPLPGSSYIELQKELNHPKNV